MIVKRRRIRVRTSRSLTERIRHFLQTDEGVLEKREVISREHATFMILGVTIDDDCEVLTEESQCDVALDHNCEVSKQLEQISVRQSCEGSKQND